MIDNDTIYRLTLKKLFETPIFMKNIIAAFVLMLIYSSPANAQFYFRDIISNKLLLAEMALYKEKKIRKIKIRSFEDDGSESEGFFCEKRLSKDYEKTEFLTNSNVSGSSLFTSYFNDKGKLEKTKDSSSISVTINTYTYDDAGRILSILSSIKSSDDDFNTELLEEHIYTYNNRNLPNKMTRVRNHTDSTLFLFGEDEQHNISIEKDSKNAGKYYYYYDNKNRLTDIVHFNEYKQKLLPDYLFEYDQLDQLIQMTATEEGGSDYNVWRYSYKDGLRSNEQCYSKERKLLGTIQYEYD